MPLIQQRLETYCLPSQSPKPPPLLECAWCHSKKPKMTAWSYRPTGTILHLCFLGCQNMPEPFERVVKGGDWENWERVDAYQQYTKKRIQEVKTYGNNNE